MRRKISLIVYIFASYLVLAFGLLFFFMGGFLVTDISGELERNNYKYYYGKVDQKRSELENFMLGQLTSDDTWAFLRSRIREKASVDEAMKITPALANGLIDIINMHNASGGFIFLNSADENSDSFYIKRNSSKKTVAAKASYSLLAGNIDLAKKLNISLSERWSPTFAYESKENEQLVRHIFKRFDDNGEDYFWYSHSEGQHKSMMLMVAVRTEDRVCAVVGIELDENILGDYLPYVELSAAKKSAYAIAKRNDIYGSYKNEVISGPAVAAKLGTENLNLKTINDVNFITYSGVNYSVYHVDDFVALVFPLRINNRLQTQENEWYLIAYIGKDEFYIHSSSIGVLLIQSVIITLLLSLGLAYYVSKVMTNPINTLAKFARGTERSKGFGITEYDHLYDIVGKMSGNIKDGSDRLDFVLRLLETKMVIFEYNTESSMIYKYGNGGDRLSRVFSDDTVWPMPDSLFGAFVNKIFENVTDIDYSDDGSYRIITIDEGDYILYMKEISRVEGGMVYRYLIDYTENVQREKLAAYEDEYDRDTSLLNKEAFKRRLSEYLERNIDSKGAVVMWVLTDLEYINDVCGYDRGDEYLKFVGVTLAKMQDEGVIVSRYANNKFVTYIPFEQMRDKVIAIINEYSYTLTGQGIKMDDGRVMPVRLAKGIAWYPSDSRDIATLCTYAEYAISSAAKNSQNTSYQFSRAMYEKHVESLSTKEYFDEFVAKKAFDFVFQPVVDLEGRKIWGYEALMRPKSRHFIYVDEVLKMAAATGKENELEILIFKEIVNKIDKNAEVIGERTVFINSIGATQISRRLIGNIFGDKLDCKVVIDVANIEKFEDSVIEAKADWVHQNDFGLCLDNFGNWISTGSALSKIKPEYIKISRDIVRGIHLSPEHQRVVDGIVRDGREQNIGVIAVGVENIDELQRIKDAGIRLAQGFLLAEPNVEVIDFVEDDILEILQLM